MNYNSPIDQLKYLIFVLIIILLLTCARFNQLHAIDTDNAAHLGISYALTTVTYGLYKNILNRECRWERSELAAKYSRVGRVPVPPLRECQLTPSERIGASTFAAATIFFIGLVKEGFMDKRLDKDDIIMNGVGVLGATGSIILFKF